MEDELILNEEDRKKLDEIVFQMEQNNESEEDIQFVVDDFKSKYGVKKKEESVLPSQMEVTESIIETEGPDTSLVSLEEPEQEVAPISGFAVEQIRTPSEQFEDTQEKATLIERTFGKNPLTDFLGDIYRAGTQGLEISETVPGAIKILSQGRTVSDKEIEDYIREVQEAEAMPETDEMRDFYRIYQEEGEGLFGVMKGLANNPSILPQILTSSITSMFTPEVAAGAGAGAGAGFLTGAGLGAIGGPFAGVTGAGGALVGMIGGATATLESALTFNELLKEELGDQAFTKENIRAILNDPEKLSRLRNRSVARGAAIGTVDAITGGIAGKASTAVISKTGRKLAGVGTGLGVEAVGGSLGEVAGKVAADQEMDVADIALEGIAGTTTAPITLGKSLFNNQPTYSINGQEYTKQSMINIINDMTDEDISTSKAKIIIKNDPAVSKLLETKLNNYKTRQDAIQEQETGGVPDVEQPEAVQEVEAEVREPDVETQEEKITPTVETVEEDITIFKGTQGKRDQQGNLLTRHPDVEGSFFSADRNIAEEYKGEGEIIEQVIPQGTTIETVEIDPAGLTPDEYNKAEQDAINASEADVVKLVTIENKLRGGIGKETQYIVKSELAQPEVEVAVEEVEITPQEVEIVEQEEVVVDQPSKERVDNIVQDIVNKVRTRNVGEDTSPQVILEAAKGYLEGSKFYQEATDIERENSVREINELLNINIPKAPSVRKVLGEPARKKVTVDEMASLKDQIRLEARAARGAVKSYKDISKSIIQKVKELSKKGSITSNQSSVIVKKVLSTNMMNPKMVDRLTTYIDKVYTKAEAADNLKNARQKLKRAKSNLRSKVGGSPDLQMVLDELFSIDPSLIPFEKIDSYSNIVNRFGEAKKVLSLPDAGEVMDVASDIINSIDEEVSTEIKETLPNELNQEIEADFDAYLDDIISNKANLDNAYNKRSKDLGKYLNNLTKEDLKGLVKEKKDGSKDYSNLENLKLIKDNISNGYVPKFAMDLKIDVEANKSAKEIDEVVSKVKDNNVLTGFSRIYGRMKGLLTGENKMTEALRSSPTYYIDDVLGNFNKKTLWENTLGRLSKSYSAYQTDLAKNVEAKADAAESLLYKTKVPTIQRETNAVQKSKYKIMAYRLQREFESNPGRKEVAPANDFIDATIKSIEQEESNSRLNQQDIRILNEIKEEFSVDGEISLDKIEKSFTENEKKALNLLDEINKSVEDKAIFTSSVLRGEKIKPINNYVHHSVAVKEKPTDVSNKTEKMVKPSTKAGTLRERTPGAKPINFDPISSTVSGATETLLDYHMTEDVRAVNKSIARATKKIFENPESSKISKESMNALNKLVNEVLTKTFSDSFVEYGKGASFVKKIQRLGYQAALASVPRAGAELGSNLMYAMTVNPQGFIKGVKDYGSFSMGNEGMNAMENLGSAETMKLYDTKNMTGKMADSNLLYTGKPKASGSVTPVVEKAKYLSQFTGVKQVGKLATGIAEKLISFPDKAISRPLWFGNFAKSFKEITGINLTEKDFQEIADGNSKYLTDEFKSAVKESTNFADEQTVKMATTTNPFNVIPKNVTTPNESVLTQLYKTGNSYMARFSQYEYAAAKNAIVSLFKTGKISKEQAVASLIGITTRMASYVVLYSVLQSAFDELFGVEEEDKEDVESLIKRQLVGAPLSLITGRGLGNIPKIPINYALEMMNEEYLDDLRKGKDYDPYKHSIVFSQINKEDLKKKSIEELFFYSLAGPLSPLAKTVSRTAKAGTRAVTAKKEQTRQKYKDELKNRLLIESLGNFGFVPFYKDIRRMIIKDMFKDKKKPAETAPQEITIVGAL